MTLRDYDYRLDPLCYKFPPTELIFQLTIEPRNGDSLKL